MLSTKGAMLSSASSSHVMAQVLPCKPDIFTAYCCDEKNVLMCWLQHEPAFKSSKLFQLFDFFYVIGVILHILSAMRHRGRSSYTIHSVVGSSHLLLHSWQKGHMGKCVLMSAGFDSKKIISVLLDRENRDHRQDFC